MNIKSKIIIMGSMITMFGCGQQTTKYSVSEYPGGRFPGKTD